MPISSLSKQTALHVSLWITALGIFIFRISLFVTIDYCADTTGFPCVNCCCCQLTRHDTISLVPLIYVRLQLVQSMLRQR